MVLVHRDTEALQSVKNNRHRHPPPVAATTATATVQHSFRRLMRFLTRQRRFFIVTALAALIVFLSLLTPLLDTVTPVTPPTPAPPVEAATAPVRVSLLVPHAGSAAEPPATLSGLVGALAHAEAALCHGVADDGSASVISGVHAVVVTSGAAAAAVEESVAAVVAAGTARGGVELAGGEMSPAASWRVWELSMDAVRAALGAGERGPAACLGDRVTLVAPVAAQPDAPLEALVDAGLRTPAGRAGSHFVVLSSLLAAARMPYTEPDDARETRHEGTGLLDALVRTATQRNGGRVAAAQCTMLQRTSGGAGPALLSAAPLTAADLARMRVVDKGGFTGATHDGSMLLPYLTRRLSGYGALDQRASWEEVVDAASLHCGIFDRRLYDAVGGLAAVMADAAVRDVASARAEHAMGAADRGGWALTLRMQQLYPDWQVWSSRATAVLLPRDALKGTTAATAAASLQRRTFSLLDSYGVAMYDVLTELQRRRVGVPTAARLGLEKEIVVPAKTGVAPVHLPPRMRYHSIFPDPCSGLNREAMGYIRPLMERYNIGLTGSRTLCPKNGDELARIAYGRADTLFNSRPDYATALRFRAAFQERASIVFQHRPAQTYFELPAHRRGRPPALVVGHSLSEVSNIRHNWIEPMKTRVDEIWATADFFATIYRRNGIDPAKVRVVPEAVDVYEYDPANYARRSTSEVAKAAGSFDNRPQLTDAERLQRYVFFTSFKWEERKGWDVLLKAYWHAFGRSAPPELQERTTLVIKTKFVSKFTRGVSKDNVMEYIERWALDGGLPGMTSMKQLPHLVLITGRLHEQELVQQYANADAFVYPTKAEGWGLPAVEAMAMGLPVLVTEWSGLLQLMERDSCFRIPLDGLEEMPHDTPYGYAESLKMALPSVEKTAELMRYVVQHPEHARRVGRRAREYAVRELSEEAVADRMDRLFVEGLERRVNG